MSTTTSEQEVVDRAPRALYIGGEWREAAQGATLEVEDPATGEAICEVPDATAEDAGAALDAAVEAQASWAKHPPRERGEILRRAFEDLTSRTEELSVLMTLEMGKPVAESRAEIAYAAEFLRWFSEEAVRIDGRYTVNNSGRGRTLTMKQPVGPCVMVTPWNFPMAMGTRKIAPAVAAGCTMVMKPAQQTPLSMLALGAILERAGLPGGVLNVVTTSSSGSVVGPLLSDPRTRKVTFTGSTAVGRKLMEQASHNVLR
ncbi:MAG: aldehyde dehydrogenase family protein, partial [Actinomycetota bacterium]|nr:aldehyde dehydrogenase family protein [Actinomycetota bacterium]